MTSWDFNRHTWVQASVLSWKPACHDQVLLTGESGDLPTFFRGGEYPGDPFAATRYSPENPDGETLPAGLITIVRPSKFRVRFSPKAHPTHMGVVAPGAGHRPAAVSRVLGEDLRGRLGLIFLALRWEGVTREPALLEVESWGPGNALIDYVPIFFLGCQNTVRSMSEPKELAVAFCFPARSRRSLRPHDLVSTDLTEGLRKPYLAA